MLYITKYALTEGIIEVEDGKYHLENLFWGVSGAHGNAVLLNGVAFYRHDEAFESKEEAIEKAESMCQRKTASLKKQLAKMESLKF